MFWRNKKQGKKLREIAHIMGFKSGENAKRMIVLLKKDRIECQENLNGLFQNIRKVYNMLMSTLHIPVFNINYFI